MYMYMYNTYTCIPTRLYVYLWCQPTVDDEEDLHDEDHIDDIDPLMDDLSPDDRLSPLERVEKYFQSEDMGDRDMANRVVPEALQTVDNLGQFELLLEIAFALANDHGEYPNALFLERCIKHCCCSTQMYNTHIHVHLSCAHPAFILPHIVQYNRYSSVLCACVCTCTCCSCRIGLQSIVFISLLATVKCCRFSVLCFGKNVCVWVQHYMFTLLITVDLVNMCHIMCLLL